MLAWHFLKDDRTLNYPHGKRDRVVVSPGLTLRCDPAGLSLCNYGLHGSERILDALSYAPGNTICRVRLGGRILSDSDKHVASVRECLWMINGEQVLREFARWGALQVIHLWDAPDVVKKYLKTGDENIREAARDVARDVAWAAARDAPWDAAWDAAREAAWAAAREAAWEAARNAAREAAWDATWDAPWDAAWDAAREKQNQKLTELVLAAKKKGES